MSKSKTTVSLDDIILSDNKLEVQKNGEEEENEEIYLQPSVSERVFSKVDKIGRLEQRLKEARSDLHDHILTILEIHGYEIEDLSENMEVVP